MNFLFIGRHDGGKAAAEGGGAGVVGKEIRAQTGAALHHLDGAIVAEDGVGDAPAFAEFLKNPRLFG